MSLGRGLKPNSLIIFSKSLGEPLSKGDSVTSAIAVEDRARQVQNIYRSIYNPIEQELTLNQEKALRPKIDKSLGWQALLFNGGVLLIPIIILGIPQRAIWYQTPNQS